MRTAHVVVVFLAGLAALGTVAYAAARQGAPRPAAGAARGGAGAIPKPAIGQHPERLAATGTARFSFSARGRSPRYRCRLDDRAWKSCRSPLVINGLTAGAHSFSVRALGAGGRQSRSARFRWQVLEPRDFSIQPRLEGIGALYPGAPPVQLPLTIVNPNAVPILVTGLRATATADPLGCARAENLLLTESSASPAAPIEVPAKGSVALPAAGASPPAIQLRDLPVNQDACQNARFPLAFIGEARG